MKVNRDEFLAAALLLAAMTPSCNLRGGQGSGDNAGPEKGNGQEAPVDPGAQSPGGPKLKVLGTVAPTREGGPTFGPAFGTARPGVGPSQEGIAPAGVGPAQEGIVPAGVGPAQEGAPTGAPTAYVPTAKPPATTTTVAKPPTLPTVTAASTVRTAPPTPGTKR